MIDNELVGVGIITYNRKDSYSKLLEAIKLAKDVDFIVTVKNFDVDYAESDPSYICNGIIENKEMTTFQVNEKLGIAYNKNVAAKWLLSKNAQHIFIIEDDILLKDDAVFNEYIQTAKEFKLEHLNFCRSFDTMITHNWLKPQFSLTGIKYKLDIFNRLSGDFSYFTANALQKAGLYDERYINALDHCEHTYRMSILGFYTPFYMFADIHDSTRFIEDTGTTTTILHDNQHNTNIEKAAKLFSTTYGLRLNQIKPPTVDQLVNFLKTKMSYL